MATRLIHHLRRAALLQKGGGLTDGQLLQCFVTDRDDVAFEALVRRHGPMVMGVCRRVLGNLPDAEDAFQATFLVLIRKAASLQSPELLANWLYGVAYRTAWKARAAAARRRRREIPIQDLPDPQAAPDAVRNEVQHLIDQELRRLPEKYRVAAVLCELEGRSRKEVARELGIPEGTLSSRLAMARRLLAQRLSKHGLVLSGSTLAAALSGDFGRACLSPARVHAAVAAARVIGSGKLTATIKAVALAEGVLKAMLVSKVYTGGAVLLAVAFLYLGTAQVVHKAGPAEANAADTSAVAQRSDRAKPPVALRWAPLCQPLYLLIANSAVQAELKLNADQKKALAAFQAEIVEPLRDWRDLDWPERDRRFSAAKEQTKKGLPTILSGAQVQRLHEIELQQRSCRLILADDEIATKLKLTAEQRRVLAAPTEKAALQSQRLCIQLLDVSDVYKNCKANAVYKNCLPEVAEERRGLIQQLVKLHAESYQRFQAGLTEEQRKLFQTMLGKPIDIAALLAAID
jgi:RNA polymerase sigma factor (sigma-70 family)